MEGFGCNVPNCPYCARATRDEVPHDALATSDIYLDFIRPRSLHVSRDGAVSFEPDEGE